MNVRELKGIGRYSTELIKRMKNKVNVSIISLGKYKRINGIFKLPFKICSLRTDVYHATIPDVASTIVKIRKNVVVTFHDLIPYYAWKSNMFRLKAKIGAKIWSTFVLKDVAKKAKFLIVPSSQTKKELIEAFDLLPEKIKVIPEGVSETFRHLNLEREYIVFFGNFSKRKRVDLAVEAYKKVLTFMENPPTLILGGGYSRSAFQQQFNILELTKDIRNRVIIKNKISDYQLLNLYNKAVLHLFTSDYEGFGLPILEAARCKTVTLVRKEAKIPNETKRCGVVTPTKKLPKIMCKLIENKKKRERLAEKCYKKSLRFSWKKCIEETFKVYEEVVK